MNTFPEVLPDLTEQKALFPPIPIFDRRRQIFLEDYPRQKMCDISLTTALWAGLAKSIKMRLSTIVPPISTS